MSDFKITCSIAKAYERQDGAILRKYIGGLASGTQTDLDGERMADTAIEAFRKAIQTGMTLPDGQWSLIPLRSGHRHEWDDVLGWITNAEVDKEYNLWIEAELDQENPVAMGLYKKLTRTPELGKPLKLGLSVGGSVLKAGWETDELGAGMTKVYYDVDLREVSVVSQPAYPTSYLYALSKSVNWDALHPVAVQDEAVSTAEPQADPAVHEETILMDDVTSEVIEHTPEAVLEKDQHEEVRAEADAEETTTAESHETADAEADAERGVSKLIAAIEDRVGALSEAVERIALQLTEMQSAFAASTAKSAASEAEEAVSEDKVAKAAQDEAAQVDVIKNAVIAALEPIVARLDRLEDEPVDKSYAVLKSKYDDLPFEERASREIKEVDGRAAVRRALELAFDAK